MAGSDGGGGGGGGGGGKEGSWHTTEHPSGRERWLSASSPCKYLQHVLATRIPRYW